MIKLSNRLQIVYDMVDVCDTVADVGCDHGYLSMALIENGIAKRAIAMDVNKGPLQVAKENVLAANLADRFDFRLSDGVAALSANEAQVICICGMGGALIKRIMDAGLAVLKEASSIIIEPQSEYYPLRKFLMDSGFVIDDETLTTEENKIYPIIKLHYEIDSSKRVSYEDYELEYGPWVIKNNPELLTTLLNKNSLEYQEIISNLKSRLETSKGSEAIEKRIGELTYQLELIDKVKNTIK
ncbi:MAG: class I SAM-dependent methyltransferase [Pseudobutyrivibrio sp.]|nr:class I SAM-dependent methyltransferase [Pseudobutyrivibrio sp.]